MGSPLRSAVRDIRVVVMLKLNMEERHRKLTKLTRKSVFLA